MVTPLKNSLGAILSKKLAPTKNQTIQKHLNETQKALLIKESLIQIIGNPKQVAIILLVAKGYYYKEITKYTRFKK